MMNVFQQGVIAAGAAAASDPHALPGGDYGGNLVLHLHPESGYWQDASKTIVAEASDPVYVWADASGAGNDLVQATGANQPIVEASPSFNGYSGSSYDGVNDRLWASYTANSPLTRIIVALIDTDGGTDYIMSGNNVSLAIRLDSLVIRYLGSGSIYGTGSLSTSVVVILGFLSDGASSSGLDDDGVTWINGNIGSLNPAGIYIGSHWNGGSAVDCKIAEVIDIHSALSLDDRNAIVTHLQSKYIS